MFTEECNRLLTEAFEKLNQSDETDRQIAHEIAEGVDFYKIYTELVKKTIQSVEQNHKAQRRAENMTEWEHVLKEVEIVQALEIITDALCHGFEFKVENHKLYARETPTENSTK